MLENAGRSDAQSRQWTCQAEFSTKVEELRQAKLRHKDERAQEQERSMAVRERIRLERENAMPIDVDSLPEPDQIAELMAELERIDAGIDEIETKHKTSCDEALENLLQCALALKAAMQ